MGKWWERRGEGGREGGGRGGERGGSLLFPFFVSLLFSFLFPFCSPFVSLVVSLWGLALCFPLCFLFLEFRRFSRALPRETQSQNKILRFDIVDVDESSFEHPCEAVRQNNLSL